MPEPRREPRSAPRRSRAHRSSGRVRRRRTVVALVLGLALVAALFAFVYPTRTYFQQRKEVTAAERRLELLQASTRALERDNARLQSDAEVERQAREDYGLVRPGETPYVLVPAPQPTAWVP